MRPGVEMKHTIIWVILLSFLREAKSEATIDQLFNVSTHTYTIEYSGVITCPHEVQYCIGAKYFGIDEKAFGNRVFSPLFCTNSSQIQHFATMSFESNGVLNSVVSPYLIFVHNCTKDGPARTATVKLEMIDFKNQTRKTEEFFNINLRDSDFHQKSAEETFARFTKDETNLFTKEEFDTSTNETIFYQVRLNKTVADEVPPGEISTQPNSKIVFNAPYDVLGHTYFVQVTNLSNRRIRYKAKVTNNQRLFVNPTNGTVGPDEAVIFAVYCSSFYYKANEVSTDKFIVDWTNLASREIKETWYRDWFEEHDLVRTKSLPIVYNP